MKMMLVVSAIFLLIGVGCFMYALFTQPAKSDAKSLEKVMEDASEADLNKPIQDIEAK